MTDLSRVYTSSRAYLGNHGAILRCDDHPEWEVDIDGNSIPDVMSQTENHIRTDHEGGPGADDGRG